MIGQATRLAAHLTRSVKAYEATIRFGIETDTYDSSGAVVRASDAIPAAAHLQAALSRFVGVIDQTPPAYSAKMVEGERAHVRARGGQPLQPRAVSVTVHQLELLGVDGPEARVRIRCSAGFYVRSLAHDLGKALGTGAILAELVRTEAAGFRLGDAVSFERLVTERLLELLTAVKPMASLLNALPSASLTDRVVLWARHGRELGPSELTAPLAAIPDLVRMLGPDGRMIGLAERSPHPGFLHPAVVFS